MSKRVPQIEGDDEPTEAGAEAGESTRFDRSRSDVRHVPPPVADEEGESEPTGVEGQTRVAKDRDAEPSMQDAPPEPDPDDENATRAGPPIIIEVIEGPDAGTRQHIRGGRMVIGRGEGCDLRLNDAASSRRHVELVAGFNGLVLRDLGSGNGTLVNDKRATEVVLKHKDVIALGQSLLLVIDELKRLEEERAAREAAKKAAEEAEKARVAAEKARKKAEAAAKPPPPPSTLRERFALLSGREQRAVIGVGVTLLALLLLGLLFVIKPNAPEGPSPAELRYGELFRQGTLLMQQKEWVGALERFSAARDFLATPDVNEQMETCQREAKAQELVESAKKLSETLDWENAVEALKQVNPSSHAAKEAKELLAKFEVNRIHWVRNEKAPELINAGEYEKAIALLKSVPPDPVVTNAIAELEERLKKRKPGQSVPRPPSIPDALKPPTPTRWVTQEVSNNSSPARPREGVDLEIAGVVRKIDTANFEGALADIDRLEAVTANKAVATKVKHLKKIVPNFARAYREGMARFNAGAYDQAAEHLLNALTLYEDMDIIGGLDSTLRDKALKAFSLKGRDAIRRQEYGVAAKAFRRLLELNPDSGDARNGLKEVSRRAGDVYAEAAMLKGRSPEVARRKFKEIFEMVPPEHELYRQAREQLDSMGDD